MENELAAQRARSIIGSLEGVAVQVRNGGAVVDVLTKQARASIALQGAHVLSWLPEGQAHDVLWLSSSAKFGGGKPIRGGIPICWPWFGQVTGKPQHGYARNAIWNLIAARRDGEAISLTFALPDDAAGREQLDGEASLRFHVQIGSELTIAAETRNMGLRPLTLTAALHTYFRVGDVTQVAIAGLDGQTFRDNTDGGREKVQAGSMKLPRETVAIFDEAPSVHVLDDPLLKRRITATRTGGKSTVVWNPGNSAANMPDIPAGTATSFVCIESGAVGRAAMTLGPGEIGTLGARYQVGSMD